MTLINAQTFQGNGPAYTLTNGDNLNVGRNVVLDTLDVSTIVAEAETTRINVAGYVKSGLNAIFMAGVDAGPDTRVLIAETGVLQAQSAGVNYGSSANDATLINRGTILARWGVFGSLNAGAEQTVINAGNIQAGEYGVFSRSTADFVLEKCRPDRGRNSVISGQRGARSDH